jgi:hypothetical protein
VISVRMSESCSRSALLFLNTTVVCRARSQNLKRDGRWDTCDGIDPGLASTNETRAGAGRPPRTPGSASPARLQSPKDFTLLELPPGLLILARCEKDDLQVAVTNVHTHAPHRAISLSVYL